MSYRELRNCAEMLRALGFPRLISIENFRTPNFNLVAEILLWTVQRFDPGARIPSDIDTEQDRVIFIRSVAQFMAAKANVRLNTKKLYQADGFAVQETLKALSLLYGALQFNIKENDKINADEEGTTILNFDVTNKLNDMKQLRSLATQITSRGASLFDLLRREVDLRDIRTNIINRQLELTEVEEGLQSAIKSVEMEAKEFQSSIENVGSDEANLEAKIEKKKTGLERGQKRLQTLKKVRPAFMDEYEKLEDDLKKNYYEFSKRFMNLSFLENSLEEQEKLDNERRAEREAIKKGQEKLRGTAGGFSNFMDDDDSDDDDDVDDSDDDDDDDDDDLLLGMDTKEKMKPQVPKHDKGSRKMFGSMAGVNDLDSDLDSELGLNLDDGPDSDLEGLESDLMRKDGLPQGMMQSGPTAPSLKSRPQQQGQMGGGVSPDDDDHF